MANSLRKIVQNFKEQLLSSDAATRKNAVCDIEQSLRAIEGENFIQIVLDSDIQVKLLELLIKTEYSDCLDILSCIERLCSYKIYFSLDHAVETANIILKNILGLRNFDKFDNVLIESLKIITLIIENLDSYFTKNNLIFLLYLDTISNFLTQKNDPQVVCSIIKMCSALLLHEKFQKIINNDILDKIDKLFDLGLRKLSQIFNSDEKCCVIGVSKLCDSSLRMLLKLQAYKKHKIEIMFKKIQNMSFNCLKFICIPYIREFGEKDDYIHAEYLVFLKTFLTSNINRDIIIPISVQLVKCFNFVIITKYLEKSNKIFNIEEKGRIRDLCFRILCELIVNISETKFHLFNEDKCKKYLFKNLTNILDFNIQNWINFLNNDKLNMDTKYSIIKLCTTYYVYSSNIKELNPEHLHSLINFLKHFPESATIDIYYLKDLWLLFSVVFYFFFREITNESALFKATLNLGKLLSIYEACFKNIMNFHISIIYGVFINPFFKKEIVCAVTNHWLLHSLNHSKTHKILVRIVGEIPAAATLFLTTLQSESVVHANAAASVLRTALQFGPLKANDDFIRQLFGAIPTYIKKLNQGTISESKVKSCIYIISLSSLIETPVNRSILNCSVNYVASIVGSLGLNELPTSFYINVFEYIHRIFAVAKANNIREVFLTIMTSKPMLLTLQEALVEDNQDISIPASQIFNFLLDFQIHNRIYCRNTITLNTNFLVKILSVQNNQHLELNVQILKSILFKPGRAILELEINENIIKGLYYRCLNLVSKPGEQNLNNLSLRCLEGILRFAHIKNFSTLDYLLEHSGNHTMIFLYFDPSTARVPNETFFSFIHCWLQFSIKKKENILSKLSINYVYWKISLTQISDLILRDKYRSIKDNLVIVRAILRQLSALAELLPTNISNYIKSIDENIN